MAVRTFRLGEPYTLSAALAAFYTVPTGRTLIVRSIVIFNAGPLVASCRLVWHSSAGGQELDVVSTGNLNAGSVTYLDRWVVGKQDDTLKAVASIAGQVRLWISGSLLQGVAS